MELMVFLGEEAKSARSKENRGTGNEQVGVAFSGDLMRAWQREHRDNAGKRKPSWYGHGIQ